MLLLVKLNSVYAIQLVVKSCQTGLTTYRVYKHPTGCTTRLTRFDNQLYRVNGALGLAV